MSFFDIAGAACRALTARKHGPSLYDICDPVLLTNCDSDAHLSRFYRTALGNPALRPLLRRTGLPALRDEGRLGALRAAIMRARDDAAPDWAAVGAPVAELMAGISVRHPQPPVAAAPVRAPGMADIENTIQVCAKHLLRSYAKNGFIPTYAAFNLIGSEVNNILGIIKTSLDPLYRLYELDPGMRVLESNRRNSVVREFGAPAPAEDNYDEQALWSDLKNK